VTTLAQISETQAQKATTANENFVGVSPAAAFGRKASTTSGLTWGYFGGVIYLDGVATTISDGTTLLAASTTNYVERTRAGVVSDNTTGFTAGSIPLYTVVTGGSTISSYTDYRQFDVQLSRGRLAKSIAGSGTTTLSAAESRIDELKLTGALICAANVVVPTVAAWYLVDNATTGAYTATVKTSAGSGIAVPQGTRALLYCDGTDVKSAVTAIAEALKIVGTFTAYASGSLYHRGELKQAATTLSGVTGASVTATGLIPDGALLVGVTTRVTTALGTGSGTTGYTVGDGSDADLWGDITGTAIGTNSGSADFTAAAAAGAFYPAAQDVVITAKTGNFNGTGVIEVVAHYLTTAAS